MKTIDILQFKTSEELKNFDFNPYMCNTFRNWIRYIKYPIRQIDLDKICELASINKGKEMYNSMGDLYFNKTI